MYSFPYFVLYAETSNFQNVESSWLYHDSVLSDSTIWYGNPYRFTISISGIPPVPTSILDTSISGEIGFFDAFSIQPGDWISGYEQGGRALRIIDIINVTSNTITIVAEDTERYNTFENRSGNGDPSISPGGYLFFRVVNNIPYLQMLDDNNPSAAAVVPAAAALFTDANWSTDIIQRFKVLDDEYGLLYEFINHGYQEGQLLKIAKISDVIPSTVIGTNTSPFINSGDTAKFGNKIVTFPTLSNAQEIVNWINSQMFCIDGCIVASIHTTGAIKLTSIYGHDMEIYDINGSTISTGLGFGYLGNGIYEGKLIAVQNTVDVSVAIIKKISVDPNKFYYKWLGELSNIHNSPGGTGDIIYINNTGHFSNINTGKVGAVKLNTIIPAITVGIANATSTDVSININQVYISTSGTTTVDQIVIAINNANIPNIIASNFNGALKIINIIGGTISINDFGTAVVDFGIKPISIGKEERVLILEAAVLGSGSLFGLSDVSITPSNLVDGDILTWSTTDNKWEAKLPPTPTPTLQSLTDVNITETIIQGSSILTWSTTNNKWEANVLTLDQISNVNASSPTENQVLKYNSTTTKWESSTNDLQNLNDVNITDLSTTNGHVLTWVSADNKWEAKPPGTGATNLQSLTDVNINESTISNKQVLSFNLTSGKWEATSQTLSSLTDVNTSNLIDGYILTWVSTDNKWEPKASSSGMKHIIEDTTPQLGGDLDVNSHKIIATGTNDIILQATGGNVLIEGAGSQARIEGFTKSDIIISGGIGDISGAGGNVILQGGANSSGTSGIVKIEDPNNTPIVEFHTGSLTAQNYAIISNAGSGSPVTITAAPATSNVDISISPAGTGKIILSSSVKIVNDIWPAADGTAGQALLTDGNGNLYWGTSSSAPNLILETPTDGDFTSPHIVGGKLPAVTTWVPGTTKIADAMDDLNEILGMLLPNAPANLSTKILTLNANNTRSGIAIKFASGATVNSGTGTVTSGQQVYTTFSNTATTNAVLSFGSGNSGTLTANLNGVTKGQIAISSTSSNVGTNQSLQITRNDDYPLTTPGFYKDLDALISGTAPVGANSYQMIHSQTGSTNLLYFVYDSFITSPTIDGTSVTQKSSVVRYSSSVPHYDTNSVLYVNLSAHNLSGQTYLDTNVVEITSNPNIGTQITLNASDMPSAVSGALPVNVGTQTLSNKQFTISGNNIITSNITIRGRNSYTDGSYTTNSTNILVMSGTITPSASSPIQEMQIFVNNLGTTPTGASQYAQRIGMSNADTPNDDPTTAATWNSQNTLPTYEAAIVGGILSHNQINYGGGAYLPV